MGSYAEQIGPDRIKAKGTHMKRFFDHLLVVVFFSGLQVLFLLSPVLVRAGGAIPTPTPVLDCGGANQAWASQGIPCRCINGQVVCDQPSGGHKSSHGTTSGNIKAMIAGTLVEGLLNSLTTAEGQSQGYRIQKRS